MNSEKTIKTYNSDKAKQYDDESQVIRGNRISQRLYLLDVLSYLKRQRKVERFVELACGTGYFSEVFYEVFPQIDGYVTDGSDDMLSKAKERFSDQQYQIAFEQLLFEDFDVTKLKGKVDIIFSAFAIHHLVDEQKWILYKKIYHALLDDGVFILFDSFRPKDRRPDAVLEYLCCMDIKRRTEKERGRTIPIEKIIEKDRELKIQEGDQEGSLEDHFAQLEKIGFSDTIALFQEARYAGLLTYKKT